MAGATSALRRLKDETADLHLLAEQHVRILDADATRADYERYLRAMWGFHAPVEEMFVVSQPLAATGFDPHERRRAQLLARDLAALGDAGPWARCVTLPAATTLAHVLGIAYVLEGSTLGGRFILAKLPPGLAAVRGMATAFLTGYGAETGARWRAFAAITERELADDESCAAAVAGARDTFRTLVAWLAQHETFDATRGMPHLKEAS